MKIVIAASEVVPFAKTGGLADVAGALPLALEDEGHQIIIVVPRYKVITDSKFKTKRLNENVSYTAIGRDIKVYFIENGDYFNRDGLYGDAEGDHPDNIDRFSYYCRAAIELLKELDFKADVVHVHDWQASLIPVYLKTMYANDPFYRDMATVLTIHNIGYQGVFPREQFPKLGLDWSLFSVDGLEFYNKVNILKGGLIFADLINTVSPTYSLEIQEKKFGFGLDGLLRRRRNALFGILNGIDYSIWNPQTDRFIFQNYSSNTADEKSLCKHDLQKTGKLPLKKDIPVVGIVSRLAEQKGFDIIGESIEEICSMDIQLVILGTGDLKYHQILEKAAKGYPQRMSLNIKFDDALAHKIYAGSDIFLMPSQYEPCGLGQLIAFRYGAIPVVFKTGGLADTVTAKNGFSFDDYSRGALLKTLKKAVKAYHDKEKWGALVKKAMDSNFSWKESAKKYLGLYAKAKTI